MPRFVPEKTLEHWCSIYLAYWSKTHVALWWPAIGADIEVDLLPNHPGKAFQLELKSGTTNAGGRLDIVIDTAQLFRYSSASSATYYVFPDPQVRFGHQDIADYAQAYGVAESELGFSRSGVHWFANWMVVVPAHALANFARVNARGQRTMLIGRAGLPGLRLEPWRDFLGRMRRCGDPSTPQMIRVPPGGPKPDNGRYSYEQVREWLFTVARVIRDEQVYGAWEDLLTLVSVGDGYFTEHPDDLEARGVRDSLDELSPSRIGVFVGAEFL